MLGFRGKVGKMRTVGGAQYRGPHWPEFSFRTFLDDSVCSLFCWPPFACAPPTGNILIKAFDLAAFGWRIMNVGQQKKKKIKKMK